jgi:hypothetical protein
MFALLALSGCSDSNNLLLGRVEATVDNHKIVVTDCYRTEVPPPRKIDETTWEFMPCRDAAVTIHSGKVTVNGRAYGRLDSGDGVLVDHGRVSIVRAGAG